VYALEEMRSWRDGVRGRFIVLWKWREAVLANIERFIESS
jgi:hypothetical protein